MEKTSPWQLSASDPLDLLKEGAAALGLDITPSILEQCRVYLTELKRWNARVNLTGLKTDRDLIIKHFLDSLAVAPFLKGCRSLADLGAGAGFPGMVLKLINPDLTLTLVEARQKKAAFLEYLVSRLHLTRVEVLPVHLTPEMARRWGPRCAAVISRATFPLGRFLNLAAPLLLPGGLALALKGPQLPPAELLAAQSSVERLGLAPLELQEYRLPLSGEPRLLVLARRREE
jgi:16S rRNA (guanine527-N7)-methyltransferase